MSLFDQRGNAAVETLKGVGPAIAARLVTRGVETVRDLLYWLPLEYRDIHQSFALADLPDRQWGSVCGTVTKIQHVGQKGRRRLEIGLATDANARPSLWCVWFFVHAGLLQRFNVGQQLRVVGDIQRSGPRCQIVHPDWIGDCDAKIPADLAVRYPSIEGVPARTVSKLCRQACALLADEVEDPLPAAMLLELQMPTLSLALRIMHATDVMLTDDDLSLLHQDAHPAQRRLKFQELLMQQRAILARRAKWAQMKSVPIACDASVRQQIAAVLPFELTVSQQRVVVEVLRDMLLDRPMHRLLQGDVGSGKTAIAFFAAMAAARLGHQVALMVPTELLAQQHAAVMRPWAERLGKRIGLLTAGLSASSRSTLQADIAAGSVSIVVGTHTLIGPNIHWHSLALAIVDEQHRFGVLQRMRLRGLPEACGQSRVIPHLLVMTATPIPRTLALTVHGDLDVSVLQNRPDGRRPAETTMMAQGSLQQDPDALTWLKTQLAAGEQVYVVSPLIDDSDKVLVAAARSTFDWLAVQLPNVSMGLVHGKLSVAERDAALGAFRAGRTQLLVATTVIEVGIDVPQVNVMIIEHAERFGVAQLHQLRGRIGRSGAAASCLLLCGAKPGSAAFDRVTMMTRNQDGFAIAEADFQHRGPGDVMGTRQSGLPTLRLARLPRDHALLLTAQRCAAELFFVSDDRMTT